MPSGNDTYKIILEDDVVRRDIPRLPQMVRQHVKKAIREKLTRLPETFGKPLRHNWKGFFRLRVGDYRVVYRIDEPRKTVCVVAIKHRRFVYEEP
ncbi:MAG: type II toxin-antitoxin system RelE/ParE family toxin [Rhodospirillales bacterium]|nr:type II toxin-antitoxin system RelE/ParE family toxin [Alphaproteobacteria bacterium]MCB9981694.1 type II toxin-antitoxin system RelE/ParE family toxin [Rhodospirillales bacterium]